MAAAATVSGGKRRSRSEGESDRAGSEQSENASSPAPSTRSSAKQQIRHRASIACASCRERRIRCVVSEGESECAQCRRTGAACIIKDDDERRRPISKAYMSSLSDRISLLESMLKERGVAPPPAIHPPKTRQEAQARQQQEHQQAQTAGESAGSSGAKLGPPSLDQPPTPPGSGDEDIIMADTEQAGGLTSSTTARTTTYTHQIDSLLLREMEQPKKETGTRHILCARGNSVFDQSVGRARFFGPTANSHVHARSAASLTRHDRPDQIHRVELLIASLRPATHEHLMRCFWDYYNSWQQVVDEAAFEAGRTTQDPRFYSPFLHLAILAIGYRFGDWDREDMKMLTVANRESTLHMEAKAMVEVELERPGGVPSVQALLMVADLECGAGRDATGWMYTGMANRLAFDLGLHVNAVGTDISDLERQTRRQAMAGCVMFDRKWSLLLGRPTAIKGQDVAIDVLPRVPGKGMVDQSVGTVASYGAINRQMFELLDLAGKVADFQNSTAGAAHVFATKAAEDRAYLHFVGLERLFHNWYRRLPENLTWKPVNIKSAHMGFFILHQQFHVCMIILHRPWAKYGPMSLDGAMGGRYPSPETPGQEDVNSWMAPLQHNDNRASMSRSMCTQHAIRIARIFWHHRQRFDGRRVVLTCIQHAGTAALALMAALAHKSAELDHQSNLRYLQVLSSAIYDMSHLYQPAARMYQLLKTMLVEIRSEMVKSGGFDVSSLVGRYQGGGNGGGMVFGSSHWSAGTDASCPPTDRFEALQEEERATKRRRMSSLSSVDFSCLAPSFLTNSHGGCPSPPASSRSFESSNPPITTDHAPGEPGTFDLDFFHASFVDFINTGGDGPATDEWVPTDPPANTASPPPILIPTVSGDLSAFTYSMEPPAAPKTDVPAVTIPHPAVAVPATTAPVDEDDDSSVDKTIEDWLAEPSKPTVSTPIQQTITTPCNPPAELFQPTASPTVTPSPQNTIPGPTEPRTTLSHATADGVPILRDPYILSIETELGVGFDFGPDVESSTTTAAPAEQQQQQPAEAEKPIDALEWFNQPTSPANAVKTAAAAVEVQDARVPAPPVTPVTLDELVLSVEEAVGSARARARARAARGSVSAGSVAGSVAGSIVVGGEGRNRELDFLSL
ncbi:hypothetical protein C8A05DRAFT_33653 [Staphylotrichum tortipilum]|uniref:Zn(2)-C6 fungal-type domain-containing protein n=1 Tax=Staphylotrichum tortipilum TaxID=2831512 RepID=A0AAN6RUK1_9PEZI|nr:hypothetical protein C8A05DRAFT_33653 [Staphylotrichum longicolle]